MTESTLKNSLEKIPVKIFGNRDEGSAFVAREIASLIKEKNRINRTTVLGLATGGSPLLLYKELIRIHKEEGLSFRNVISFNLDEYYPMEPGNINSYHRFMHEHFFSQVDILPENINIPDGTLSRDQLPDYCRGYENKIKSLGGLDIQILGIGRNGHIGFNEPGAQLGDETRLVHLDDFTIEDAARDFEGKENVPGSAITMGVKTIMQAERIFMMAWGHGKSEVVKAAVEGPVTAELPASFLQNHPDALFVVDTAAGTQLSRIETPWLTGECEWSNLMKKKAIIWLSKQTGKPVLKLTETDYKEWGLKSLLQTGGKPYDLNIEIHNKLQQTITGWPGGKPGSDDRTRPERSEPFPKKVVVFSPHPDDDVISMGGTFIRLAEQGHDVHVAYQTSGNIAVSDDDARRYLDFLHGISGKMSLCESGIKKFYDEITRYLNENPGNGNDHPAVLAVKGQIRKGEAIAASRFSGVKKENIHFLDMPFYETGSVEKKPLSQTDINIIVDLLREVKPHQIYAAGDLQDPHGTHAVCLHAVFDALKMVKEEDWAKDCWVWLYRGAWQEWNIEDVEMAVPLSPDELRMKRMAVFKHQSQKDEPVFPGSDSREFWERAEDRNRETARIYDSLGLTEYEAIEAFRRYKF